VVVVVVVMVVVGDQETRRDHSSCQVAVPELEITVRPSYIQYVSNALVVLHIRPYVYYVI